MKPFMLLLAVLLLFPLCYIIKPSFAYTGTITYNAGTDTITAIGGNTSNPIAFRDLYDADIAGGWNQITLQGSNQYTIDCKIIFGNGTREGITYFTDTNKQVIFEDGTVSGWEFEISVKEYAIFTLGTLINSTDKSTKDGCSISSIDVDAEYFVIGNNWDNGGTIYLYDSKFYSVSNSFVGRAAGNLTFRAYNCLFTGCYPYYLDENGDIFNICVSGSTWGGIDLESAINEMNIYGCNYAFYFETDVPTSASNVYIRGSVTGAFRCWAITTDKYLINSNVDNWAFSWGGVSTAEVYRQSTFNLYVLNGDLTDYVENANVTLTHDGSVYGSWLTNSSGQIATQTLTYGYYNQTGGNTMYGGTAWTLTITHDDWATYESSFYPYSKIDWSISMQSTSTADNNMLLAFLFLGCFFFTGIVIIKRRND